jgi:hypothetical protein
MEDGLGRVIVFDLSLSVPSILLQRVKLRPEDRVLEILEWVGAD